MEINELTLWLTESQIPLTAEIQNVLNINHAKSIERLQGFRRKPRLALHIHPRDGIRYLVARVLVHSCRLGRPLQQLVLTKPQCRSQ